MKKKFINKNAASLITKNLNWNTYPWWQQEEKHDFVEVGVERQVQTGSKHFNDCYFKETQTFRANQTESFKYCIIVAGSNTKILKIHSLLNKMLLSLSATFSVYCDSCLLRLSQWQNFFSSWTVGQSSAEFLRILNVTSDPSCHKYFCFLVWKWFSPS